MPTRIPLINSQLLPHPRREVICGYSKMLTLITEAWIRPRIFQGAVNSFSYYIFVLLLFYR